MGVPSSGLNHTDPVLAVRILLKIGCIYGVGYLLSNVVRLHHGIATLHHGVVTLQSGFVSLHRDIEALHCIILPKNWAHD